MFLTILFLFISSKAAPTCNCGPNGGDNCCWEFQNNVLTITGSGAMNDYLYDIMPWYLNRESINEVKIEEGITKIGEDAFELHTSLTTVTIPNSVSMIGSSAFESCTSLTSVKYLGVSEPSYDEDYPPFEQCTNLQKITVFSGYNGQTFCEKTVEMLIECGDFTLEKGEMKTKCNCVKNSDYDGQSTTKCKCQEEQKKYPSDEIEMCYSEKYECGANCEAYYDGERMIITGSGAMNDYSNTASSPWYSIKGSIKEVIIEEGITTIGNRAFYYHYSLTSLTIPDSVATIGDFAFESCESLTSLTIPDSVTTIGSYAFRLCKSLTSLRIPDSVKTIGDSTFELLTSLTSVTIGQSVTKIGMYLFKSCTSLTSVKYLGLSEPEHYQYTLPFDGCSELEKITVLSEYNGQKFCGVNIDRKDLCLELTKEYGEESTTCTCVDDATHKKGSNNRRCECNDDYEPFGNECKEIIECGDFTTAKGDEKNIRRCACVDGADFITGSDNTCECSEGYYSNKKKNRCAEESKIIECEDFTKEKNEVDATECTCIENAEYDGQSTTKCKCKDEQKKYTSNEIEICYTAKYECEANCEAYYDGERMIITGSGAMYGYSYSYDDVPWYPIKGSIKEVIIEEGITTIDRSAFDGCELLTSVRIPNSVTTIGEYAFRSCKSLTSITIPDSVTTIEYDAFEACTSLTSVKYLGLNEPQYNSGSGFPFDGCSKLETITVLNEYEGEKFCGVNIDRKDLCLELTKEYGEESTTCTCVDDATHKEGSNNRRCECNEDYAPNGNECKALPLLDCGDFTQEKGTKKTKCNCVGNSDRVDATTCECDGEYYGNDDKTECMKLLVCGDFTQEKGVLKTKCNCVGNASSKTETTCECNEGYEGKGNKCEKKDKDNGSISVVRTILSIIAIIVIIIA